MNTYYCPRGCNVCDERAAIVTGFECGACGSTMTIDSTRYDKVHERIEEQGVAACEREQMNDDLASLHYALQDLSSSETRTGAQHRFAPQALAALLRVKKRLEELGKIKHND